MKLNGTAGAGNFTLEDTSILMFSGKGPFDMGSKEMCDLIPTMAFKVAQIVTPFGIPGSLGVCIYGNCTARFLNQAENLILPIIIAYTNNTALA